MISDAERPADYVRYAVNRVRRTFGNLNRMAGLARGGALWMQRTSRGLMTVGKRRHFMAAVLGAISLR